MISLAQHLAGFTTLTPPELAPKDSPAERERRKGAQQKAEDFIYTLNHAVTCLSLTDFLIAPFFSTVFGWNICGHGHDHGADGHATHGSGGGYYTYHTVPTTPPPTSPPATPDSSSGNKVSGMFTNPGSKKGFKNVGCDPGCDHTGHPPPTTTYATYHYSPPSPPPKLTVGQRIAAWWKELTSSPKEYLKKHYPGFKEWAIGEAAGDIGAVPLTLAVQHFTPGVMTGIQRGLEPIVGRLMHKRAERAAERWADKHGIARDAEEVVTRAQELYQYEIRHLPQMVMWTLSSIAINYGVMKYRNPELSVANFAKGKAAGSAITAGLVFGARTFAPDKAHAWDSKVGGKVVVPITKKVGRLFGIEERDVDDFHKRSMDEDHPKEWSKRVADTRAQALAVNAK